MRKPKLQNRSEWIDGVVLDDEGVEIVATRAKDDTLIVRTLGSQGQYVDVWTKDVLAAIRLAGHDPVFAAVENLLSSGKPTPEDIDALRKAYLDATEDEGDD